MFKIKERKEVVAMYGNNYPNDFRRFGTSRIAAVIAISPISIHIPHTAICTCAAVCTFTIIYAAAAIWTIGKYDKSITENAYFYHKKDTF